MKKIRAIAKKYNLKIIEDACHSILSKKDNLYAGNQGDIGCFSLHPLKNLNVWGDGGFMTIKNKALYKKISLMRNHGLVSRNITKIFSYNSRLDTIQAVVANHLIPKIKNITQKRIKNSKYLDKRLANNKNLQLIPRNRGEIEVFHLYCLRVKKPSIRKKLIRYLQSYGIDCKIHYPTAMHLQPAAKIYNYKKGDFPKTELISNQTISLPVHEFVTKKQLDFMINKIATFF